VSWLGDAVKGGADSIVGGIVNIFDDLHTSAEEKAAIAAQVQRVVLERMKVIEDSIQARYRMVMGVVEAEMKSGDNYTKRARPTLVYFGMLVIFLNHLILPWAAFFFTDTDLPKIELPTEFWYSWSGVVGLWVVGRSAEKSGVMNKATQLITGSKAKTQAFDMSRL